MSKALADNTLICTVLCALLLSPAKPFVAPAIPLLVSASKLPRGPRRCGGGPVSCRRTSTCGWGCEASVRTTAERERRRRHSQTARRQALSSSVPSDGDEGIADLESLSNPAKEQDYGDENALQYGVSGDAAGASDQFFSADTRVVFGVNALEIGLVELSEMGLARALMVTGWNQARADPVVWELLPRGFDLAWHSVSAEPSLADVAKGASLALQHRADCVVAMGGAAVIDAGKVIASTVYADKDHAEAGRRLVAAASSARDGFPQGAGGGQEGADSDTDAAPLLGPIPLVAIPVVAGLGAEVTPMADILDDDDPLEPRKVTLGFHGSAAAMPAPFMAIVEPRLMMRVPLEETWPRAFAALAGCVEGYVAGQGFVPDLMSQQGIERVSRSLARDLGFRGPLYQEREDIAFAGVVRGLVASRHHWGSLHLLATAVSEVSGTPYAVCVARLFPRVVEAQIIAFRGDEQAFSDPSRRRRKQRRRGHHANASPADENSREESTSAQESIDLLSDSGEGRQADSLRDYGEAFPSGGPSIRPPGEDNDEDARYHRACAALLKYRRVASFIGVGDGKATEPEAIISWLDTRLEDKNVPRLYRFGLRPEHVAPIVDAASRASLGSGLAHLGEAVLHDIVTGESARPRGGAGGSGDVVSSSRGHDPSRPAEGSSVEENSAQAGEVQTGPWRNG